jgi:hypothetical protein
VEANTKAWHVQVERREISSLDGEWQGSRRTFGKRAMTKAIRENFTSHVQF